MPGHIILKLSRHSENSNKNITIPTHRSILFNSLNDTSFRTFAAKI